MSKTKSSNGLNGVTTQEEALELLSAGEIDVTEYTAWDTERKTAGATLKVSEKGAVTLHCEGLRRFGATFYGTEWNAILVNADKIRKFMKDHKSELSTK